MILESSLSINCTDILDNLPSGIYFTDLKRKIIYWNKAAETITGFKADEVVGSQCFNNILMHIDKEGHSLCKKTCPLARTIRDGIARNGDIFLHHKDGHRASVKIYTIPLKDTCGNTIGAAEIFSDNSEFSYIESKIKELERIAFFDKLSALPNRDHIESELDLNFQELNRYKNSFGVLFLDIDHFKRFNDTYGHDAGDLILKTVANTLRASSRPFDIFGRWGGEEFVGIIKNVDHQKLNKIGNRYRRLIEESSITIEKEPVRVTVSIGATIARPDDSKSSVIKRADLLMYECKQKGRNCLASD